MEALPMVLYVSGGDDTVFPLTRKSRVFSCESGVRPLLRSCTVVPSDVPKVTIFTCTWMFNPFG